MIRVVKGRQEGWGNLDGLLAAHCRAAATSVQSAVRPVETCDARGPAPPRLATHAVITTIIG